jgi:histidinol-phosphate aminotransferase
VAALATLDDLPWVEVTVRRVREERSRLFRMLRKLNMLRPFPSWANFVLARFERGSAGYFGGELAARGISVHHPEQVGLGDCVRISATTPDQTDALKRALIEIASGL